MIYTQKTLQGLKLCNTALVHYLDGQARLGGRVVMLECHNVPYLIELYNQFGFSIIEKDYEEGELLRMVKILQEDEIIEKR